MRRLLEGWQKRVHTINKASQRRKDFTKSQVQEIVKELHTYFSSLTKSFGNKSL